MEMRWYQAEAVQALYKYIQDKQGTPLLVLPTGAGKGFIMGQIAKDMTEWGCRLLLVAHVKELVDQNSKQAGRLIGHDKVGVYSAGIGRRDKSHPIISAGIQSIYNKACDLGSFDLILIDESHRLNAEEGMYKTFLDEMRIINPNVRLAGLTATPFRMKSGHLTDEGGIFSDVAYEVGVRALIVQGHLSKVIGKNSTQDIDFSKLHTRMGDFIEEEVDLLMDADDVVNNAVDELVHMSKDRKGIVVFGASVKHAKHVAGRLREVTGEEVREVYGEVGATERDAAIADFKAKKFRWLVNRDCLTTGFDAPHVDCVALMRPTKSAGLYLQMAGRGLRLAEGKSDCLLLDFGENILRHGPIDMVDQDRMSRKKGKGDGEAPSKVCPECQEVVLASLRVCPACSFEFIAMESPPHQQRASILSVLSEPAKPITAEVQNVTYQVWDGKSGIATMAVSYWVNINEKIMEWVCLNHEKGSFAHQKAMQWWSMRSVLPPPEDVEQAVFLAKDGALADAKSITYLEAVGKSFPSIKSIEIGDKPNYFIGMNKSDDPWKEFDEVKETDGFFSYKSTVEEDINDMPF